ncbi:MAG: hypothetical protein ACK5A1_00170 [Planctomyces sp.]|nr:hypothetical protein [Planctomyces sp.]
MAAGLAVLSLLAALQPAAADEESTISRRYNARLERFLKGVHDWSSFEHAGVFWEREHQRSAQAGSRLAGGRPSGGQSQPRDLQQVMQHTGQRVHDFVENATYQQPTEPAVDVYETRPIAVDGPRIRQVSQTQDEVVPQATSGSRLKTDIRMIQPSLSYALKDIDPQQLPQDFNDKLTRGEYVARQPNPTVLQWAPTNFYHYPLYFEDPALERYGHTYSPLVQPFASTGKFAVQLVGLPYQMALHPVTSRQYALGYYRPGETAPKKLYQIPYNTEATLVQTAAVIGLFLILP